MTIGYFFRFDMQIAFLWILAFIILPVPCQASDQNESSLQGKWISVEATSNGESAPKEVLDKLTLVFVGDTVSVMGAPPTHFKVDTTSSPQHIDFLNSARQAGIYKLEGDTLKLCTGQNGDRPTSFATKEHTDYTYMLLKRVKE